MASCSSRIMVTKAWCCRSIESMWTLYSGRQAKRCVSGIRLSRSISAVLMDYRREVPRAIGRGARSNIWKTALTPRPLPLQLLGESFGVLGLIQNRRAAALRRDEHQPVPAGAIQAYGLAVGGAKPSGLVMQIREAIGAQGGPPRGLTGQVHDPHVSCVDRVGLQGHRIEPVVDGQSIGGQRVTRRARRIEQRGRNQRKRQPRNPDSPLICR